jgi:hypothetical protein
MAAAAKAAGYSRQRLYEWRQADPELAAAWDDALETGTDELEDEALRRALHGVAEPRFYEGEVCGYVQKYSDTLLPAQGAPAAQVQRQASGRAADVRPPRGQMDGAGRTIPAAARPIQTLARRLPAAFPVAPKASRMVYMLRACHGRRGDTGWSSERRCSASPVALKPWRFRR